MHEGRRVSGDLVDRAVGQLEDHLADYVGGREARWR